MKAFSALMLDIKAMSEKGQVDLLPRGLEIMGTSIVEPPSVLWIMLPNHRSKKTRGCPTQVVQAVRLGYGKPKSGGADEAGSSRGSKNNNKHIEKDHHKESKGKGPFSCWLCQGPHKLVDCQGPHKVVQAVRLGYGKPKSGGADGAGSSGEY